MDIVGNEIVKSVVEKFAEPLIKQLAKLSKDEWEKFKIDFDCVFTKYLSKSYDKYSKIKTVLYKTEPQYIYDFFEPPTIHRQPDQYLETGDVNTILDISKFIIIQGIGGIGKSTLLKHFFVNELEKKDLIPIFIELKDINAIDDDYTIEDLLFCKLSNLGSTLKKEYIEYSLNSGCYLFLLDGYDEILSNKKDAFFRKLDEFCDRYTDNYYIISSRPYSEFVEFQRFTVLKALPLSEEQSVALVSKINYEQAVKERFIYELQNGLYDNHKSFASNPLLLNIMLLTYDNYADIPEKLHLFYSNAFETLYSKHDATKAGYKREMLSKLTYDSFRKVFAYFCFMTYLKGSTQFTYDELKDILNRIKIPRLEFGIDDYIYDIVNSLCVIYKDGFSYVFTHRSFQEYFTAVFLKELSDAKLQEYGVQMIKRESSRAVNDAVFSMLYDMADEKFEKNILLPVLIEYEEAVPEEEEPYWYCFKDLVHTIIFRKKENEELSLWLRRDYEENGTLVEFIYRFSLKYREETDRSDRNKKSNKELYDYLTSNYGLKKDRPFDIGDVLEDREVQRLVRNTWIGESVQNILDLKEKVLQKLSEGENSLDNMMEFMDTI